MGKPLHSLLRGHRERAGMSLRDLSRSSGVSLAKLCAVENGDQDLGRLALRAIVRAFELKTREVVELVYAPRSRAA